MTIADARELEPGTDLSADICVVGAGAAGITLATELGASGRDVCLLEGGGFEPDPETQSLYDLTSVGDPIRENFMSRARYYGGTCNLWAGRCMRYDPWDLRTRPWVPDSGWPIGHRDLADYYPRAAEILGLPTLDWFREGRARQEMSERERRLVDLEALVPRLALWAKEPHRFGDANRALLSRSDRVTLVLHANVVHVQLNASGRSVDSVEAKTLDGRGLRVRADTFVLACGGLENPRLLLASRDVHSDGIGNRFDVVGRYFMDHPRAVHGRVEIRSGASLRLLPGRPLPDGSIQLGAGMSRSAQEEHGLLNHYATLEAEQSDYVKSGYRSFVDAMKVLLKRGYAGSRGDVGRAPLAEIPEMIYLLTPKEIVPHVLYRWKALLQDALGIDPHSDARVVVYFCEQPPDPRSRVTLDRETDRLGVPKLVLDWQIGPEVVRSLRRLQQYLSDGLREAGIGELQVPEEDFDFSDASHHMGTTRMSTTPRTGVVDRDCRVHGVANLYVAGSSVFPSAGHANPTLTIVALALRLAEHLEGRA